ncbi:DNA uptake protein and related DNA-binding protein [Candidatus Burkholderia verschuerenii]|uniref:DNA uptake protein and related DNA-binding protein n=1 Tax=Candidatus Burkholderia verschuerenii TaxID=242163 RepID=A0A0L0MCY7_9BURK|nr:helix-hairpin-helix domain-containing protein [Candidatus Burkholderia verschuerenii]KND60120.1 DNA uptake protein and related DNA-binding protein [Candidatus Burkholderia verschuerenii]
MFKQVLSSIVALALSLSIGSAFASVDVNTANSDALRGIKGIGPAKAKAILDERQAHGPFKDAADLGTRVKGMGGKTVQRLEAEGLTIGAAPKTAAASLASPGSGAAVSATQVSTSSTAKPVVVKK